MLLSTACVVTEPLEHLSLVLQHTDEVGHYLCELLSPGLAVDKALQHLFLLLQPLDHDSHNGRSEWQIDMICHHFGFTDALADALVDSVLRLSSQGWSRLYCLRNIWDWKILMLWEDECIASPADTVLSDESRRILEQFLNEDGCCLGAWFSEWVQSLGEDYLTSGAWVKV